MKKIKNKEEEEEERRGKRWRKIGEDKEVRDVVRKGKKHEEEEKKRK